MGVFDLLKNRKINRRSNGSLLYFDSSDDTFLWGDGYTPLDRNPEVVAGCRRIADLIGSMTIHLMANTDKGDIRIVNGLSRAIDIEPCRNMTRSTWMQTIVMNMLLYGRGNAVVLPHTSRGLLGDMEPVAAHRVSFIPVGNSCIDYIVSIDGLEYSPDDVMHFVYNPDKTYPWKGQGIRVALKDIIDNLAQAQKTEKVFMKSEWKPSIIVKVDGLTEEFSNPKGREKLLESYIRPSQLGAPWLIPAEQFQVEQVKPLSLADLAINDSVTLNKKAVAAILGVPPFILGVGDYNQKAWNSFIQNTIRPLTVSIQQEMTKKLLVSPDMYLRFNTLSLMDWDVENVFKVFGGLADRGIVTGNEVRDRLGLAPLDGLDELRILENYIPADMTGKQKKLIQGEDDDNDEGEEE